MKTLLPARHFNLLKQTALLPFVFMLLFVHVFCGRSFGQSKIDSLEKILPTLSGPLRAEVLYKLSWEYRFSDKDKALKYGEEGLALGRTLRDTGAITCSLNSLSEVYLNFGDLDQAEKITQEELPFARTLSKKLNLLGALTRLGTIWYRRGKFDRALEYQLEVLREAEKTQNPEFSGVAGLNLGLTLMDLKRYDEALERFEGAKADFEKLDFKAGVGACYVNIAEALRNKKQYQESLDAGFKGEAILKASGNNLHLSYIYLSMGDVYASLHDQPKALEYLNKSLALAQANQDDFVICNSKCGLGKMYMQVGEMAKAKSYLDESRALSEKIGEKTVLIENYAYLRDWYLLQKDFRNAALFDEKYNSETDSVFNGKMAEKVADSEAKYQTEKKEAEIAAQKLTLFRQRAWIIGLLAGLLAVITLSYLFYNRYRLRKNAELNAAIIREQQLGLNAVIEAQEAERKRIAQELHDSIAQEMAAIRMGFSVLERKLAGASPTEAGRIGELAGQLDQTCTEVRSISHIMMPPALEQQGLASSLERLLQNTLQHTELSYEFDAQQVPAQLPEKTILGLYRIAQELLNNIVKHAQAKKVVMMLYAAGNQLILSVQDDGRGFDFEAAKAKGNMGLLNILSRVSTLQGAFHAEPAQPNGTFATVRVPV